MEEEEEEEESCILGVRMVTSRGGLSGWVWGGVAAVQIKMILKINSLFRDSPYDELDGAK